MKWRAILSKGNIAQVGRTKFKVKRQVRIPPGIRAHTYTYAAVKQAKRGAAKSSRVFFLKQFVDHRPEQRAKYFIREVNNLARLVHHPSVTKLVACSVPISKLLSYSRDYNPELRQQEFARLKKEAERLAYAAKPLFLVQKFVHGTLLPHCIGELNFQERLFVFLNVASIVKYLHSVDVVHRDIKSHHVMIRRTRIQPHDPILLDLDGARDISEIQVECPNSMCRTMLSIQEPNCIKCGTPVPVTCPRCGKPNSRVDRFCADPACRAPLYVISKITDLYTPGWESPEQRGLISEGVSKLTDQYSLGLLLYFLLTGKERPEMMPTVSADYGLSAEPAYPYVAAQLHKIIESQDIRDMLAQRLTRAVVRATSPSPSKRFPTLAELMDRVKEVFEIVLQYQSQETRSSYIVLPEAKMVKPVETIRDEDKTLFVFDVSNIPRRAFVRIGGEGSDIVLPPYLLEPVQAASAQLYLFARNIKSKRHARSFYIKEGFTSAQTMLKRHRKGVWEEVLPGEIRRIRDQDFVTLNNGLFQFRQGVKQALVFVVGRRE
ncbi:MAG: protein kinase [Promethearchaeota archaeon]